MTPLRSTLLAALLPTLVLPAASTAREASRAPNVIFILTDDLGYGDLGSYGQAKIKTPNLDRMASEGTRFTQAYCGTSVCAPSRCALMTGLHMGRAPIRANREVQPEGQMPMPADTFTVGHLMKRAGYATACIGKWGLGYPGSASTPDRMGFDYFFGYNCQRHAHNYYPEYLRRNGDRVELDGKSYSHDLIAADALQWVRANKERPFFLYLALTIPHGKFQVPDLGPYAAEPWTDTEKAYAAMITRMDGDIGRLHALLKELGIDGNTLVFFSSDNGPTPQFLPTFNSNGPLRGTKRDLYEGGIRVPMIARWPGRVPAGKVRAEPWAFWDLLPTLADLTGQKLPDKLRPSGISVLPALLGGAMPRRDTLYWELHERRAQQALRMGDWKAVKPTASAPVELYNLERDPGEQHNVAAQNPEVLKKVTRLLASEREDSPLWPLMDPPGRAERKPEE